ncbi:MAG: hypothetical protein RL685_1641 [Pseudomonadota bacterium]
MSSPLPFRSLTLALLTCTSLACSEASPGPGQAQNTALDAALACAGPRFTTCDIAEPACQQRIAEVAACQWGGPEATVVQPVVSTLSQQQYRAQLSARALRDEQALTLRSAVDASLALLGLIDGGDLSVESVAERDADGVLAYYEPATKSITVIERASATNQREANATLLHEMIHALQDTAHDLAALHGGITHGSSDADLALRSLLEGEAKFHDLLFSASLDGRALTPEQLRQLLTRRREASEKVLLQGPSVLASSLQSVPYLYGPNWILQRWLEGGSEALQAAYEAVPTDVLGALQSSWGAEQEEAAASPYPAPNVYTSDGEPAEDAELIPLAYDRLGAYTVYTAARRASDALVGQQLALGWRGDQLDVYELNAGGAAARWHVTFDSSQQAVSFASLLQQNPSVSVRHEGTSVVGVVSESGNEPEWLFGPLGR